MRYANSKPGGDVSALAETWKEGVSYYIYIFFLYITLSSCYHYLLLVPIKLSSLSSRYINKNIIKQFNLDRSGVTGTLYEILCFYTRIYVIILRILHYIVRIVLGDPTKKKKHDRQLPVHIGYLIACVGARTRLVPKLHQCFVLYVFVCVCVEQCDTHMYFIRWKKPMQQTQTDDGQWGEGFNGLTVNKTSNLLLKLSLLWGTCMCVFVCVSLTVSAPKTDCSPSSVFVSLFFFLSF